MHYGHCNVGPIVYMIDEDYCSMFICLELILTVFNAGDDCYSAEGWFLQ